MSVSLYWTAYRDRPLSAVEEHSAQTIIDAASDHPNIVALVDAEGTFWEGLLLWHDPDEDGEVLRGSSALPRLSRPSVQALLEHCCDVLAALRQAVVGADWDVALDDLAIRWEVATTRFVIAPDHLGHYHQATMWEAGLAFQSRENPGPPWP